MLLAIDVGNTTSVYALWNGSRWVAMWRRPTDRDETADNLAEWLKEGFVQAALPFEVSAVICVSGVSQLDEPINRLAKERLGVEPWFLRTGEQVGLSVEYEPKSAVGADRLANVMGALAKFVPPVIVVDMGTATTFDVVDHRSVFVGGAIAPGLSTAHKALKQFAPSLPLAPLEAPERAIGSSTLQALQSGSVLGHACLVDGLVRRMEMELVGQATVVATGGHAGDVVPLCTSIQHHEPTLTLDGLRQAFKSLNDRLT